MKKETTNQTSSQDVNMTEPVMIDLLIELTDTKFWPAITICLEGWRITNEGTFKTLDPFKEPTEMARTQGRDEALRYLANYIVGEKRKRAKAEAEATAKTKAK